MIDARIISKGSKAAVVTRKAPPVRVVTSLSPQLNSKARAASMTQILVRPQTHIAPGQGAKAGAPVAVPAKNSKLFPPKNEKKPSHERLSLSSNRYQLLNIIYKGSVGTVFKAMDKMLKMEVAIKLLKAATAQNQDAISQLKVEAAVALKLSHEHIVRLHNIESEKGRIFIVMEYVDGQTLREIIESMGALSLHTILDITHSCVGALTYAHRQGVLHRDIKPENIMINRQMSLKLLDFGLAIKMAKGHDKSDYIEGSPGYLSPEQLHGLPLDARTDVFSLAAVVCELLTGKRAFPETAQLKQLYDREPVGIETLHPEIAKVLQWGLSREANARYNTPTEFYAALEQAIRLVIS